MSVIAWIGVVLAVVAAIVLGLILYTRIITKRVEAAIPKAGRDTKVDGGSIHWVEEGEGPPIVLIHGLSGQLQHFTYALAPLLAKEHRVISIDRPGCGYAERDRDNLALLPQQARMISEFLTREGIDKPFVVGHSLGGAVTLALALDYPEQVRGFSLICPLTHPESEAPPAFEALAIRSSFVRHLVGATLAVPMGVRTAEAILRQVFAPEPVPEDFPVKAGGLLGLRKKAFVTASSDLVFVEHAIAEQAKRYSELKIPGGILFGSDDVILNPDRQGTVMKDHVPHIVNETLDGRGHMIPMTAPNDCAEFIQRMIRQA